MAATACRRTNRSLGFVALLVACGLVALSGASYGGEPDQDRDGASDAVDNCLVHYNPSQSDADEDGAGDPCDGCFGDGVGAFKIPGLLPISCA